MSFFTKNLSGTTFFSIFTPVSERSLVRILVLILTLFTQQAFAKKKPADVDEYNSYQLQMLTQIFDGQRDFSQSQKVQVARVRKGDESYTLVDFGDNSVFIETNDKTSAGNFKNISGVEAEFKYNYATRTLSGANQVSDYFNSHIRQYLENTPAPGEDARWSKSVAIKDLAVTGVETGAVNIELQRKYFKHDGQDYVLLHYKVPAFSYITTRGETVIEWGEGVSVSDPGFGEIYWNASLLRAVANGKDGIKRPYRYVKTIAKTGRDNKPVFDPRTIEAAKPYFETFYGPTKMEVIGFALEDRKPDQTPIKIAANLDIMALSLAEGSANESPQVTGQYVNGSIGNYSAIGNYAANSASNANRALNAQGQRYQMPGSSNNNGQNSFSGGGGGPGQMPGSSNNNGQNSFSGGGGGPGQLPAARANPYATITNSYGQFNAATGGRFQTLVDMYGTPDKFLAALSGIGADQQKVNQALKSFNDYANGVNDYSIYVKDQSRVLKNRLLNLDARIKAENSRITGYFEQFVQSRGKPSAAYDSAVQRLVKMETEAAQITRDIERLGNDGKILYQIRQELPAYKKAVVGVSPKLGKLAPKILGFLEKVKTPLTILGGLGNIQAMYGNATSLGNFDPANSDLQLTGSYDSPLGFATDIALNIMGIAGNAASGNVPGTIGDIITFSSGRFTDLYKVTSAADYANSEAEYAHKQYILNMMRLTNMMKASEAAKIQTLLDTEYGLYTKQDPYSNGYDTTDPRIDQKTGFPKPAYWAYLKKYNPQKLVNMGIDPNMPVGGWPRKPGQSKVDWEKVNQRFNDAFKKSYPTVDPTSIVKRPTLPKNPEGPGYSEIPDWLIQQWKDSDLEARKRELNNYQSAKLARLRAERNAREAERLKRIQEGKRNPVTFDPVTWDAPVWEPPKWEPPKWVPPEFVMPEFDAPLGSSIEFTQFSGSSDDEWFSNFISYKYENMSGTVATDLRPYQEFIAKYGLRRLERLAIQAGYPNLASALTDWKNLVGYASDKGFRQWANRAPVCYFACANIQGLWTQKKSQVALGDLLIDSRNLFSSGGLSDISLSGFLLSYVLRDFGLEDGDNIRIVVSQFGRRIFSRNLSLLNAGTAFKINLRPGVASIVITALDEGAISPNTAEIRIDSVTKGQSRQTYSLLTGETATLRIAPGQ